jgi:hypothetical protein
MTHKSKETSVGSSTHVATDRCSFTSSESDCTSNATQVTRKNMYVTIKSSTWRSPSVLNQFWDKTSVIHVKQSSSPSDGRNKKIVISFEFQWANILVKSLPICLKIYLQTIDPHKHNKTWLIYHEKVFNVQFNNKI